MVAVQYHGASSRWQVGARRGRGVGSRAHDGRTTAARGAARAPAVGGGDADASWPRAADRAARRRRRRCARRRRFSTGTPDWYLALLLVPPLLWFGTVYLGSLFALLAQSFYRIDDFTAQIVREPTLATYKQLVTQPANIDIVVRTLTMAIAVTIACAIIALPIATYMARYARGAHEGVVLRRRDAADVDQLPREGLRLAPDAREGGHHRLVVGRLGLGWLLDALLALPGIGGPSLSSSYLGMFLVFVYMWLPFMILPMAAALERVPGSLLQASADLGARPAQTFRNVVLPLALPGIAAGSVFTFSLTLGDYIIPSVVGAPGYFIGMMVYLQQGTAGNIPLAAAFSVVPIVLIFVYLIDRQAVRGVRCALTRRASGSRARRVRRASRSCTCRCCHHALRVHHRGPDLPVPAARPDAALVRRRLCARRHLARACGCRCRWRAARPPWRWCSARWRRSPCGARASPAGTRSTLLFVLPIALPGIITGIALRSTIEAAGITSRFWTIVVGHATFCIVIVYNNVIARLRRTATQLDRGVDGSGRRRLADLPLRLLPQVATAFLAGGMLAFALSFDEIIVTIFTAGNRPPCRSGCSTSCSGRGAARDECGGGDRDRGDAGADPGGVSGDQRHGDGGGSR